MRDGVWQRSLGPRPGPLQRFGLTGVGASA